MPHWQKRSVRRPELNEWMKKHNIKIIDNNKRWARARPISYDFFVDPNDMDIANAKSVHFDTEPLLTIEIPKSELEGIMEFEEQVFNNMKTYGSHHYHLFNTMMEQKQTERYLRENNAAVKKAYEHYSLMLALANGGRWDAGY